MNVFFMLFVIFFVGVLVLNFFGILMEVLWIGGGFVVVVVGWLMLNVLDVLVGGDVVVYGDDL